MSALEDTPLISRGDSPAPPRQGRSLSGLPIVALLVGVPVWWVLGAFQAAFFIAAVLMAAYLLRRRNIEVPKGFGVWLIFLVWVIGGLLVLQVDAPGAVPGANSGRYLTFGYRVGWYVVCTIAGLYVLNTRRTFTTDRVCSAIAWFFVVLVGGGLLGVLQPKLSFSSALEMVLPSRLTRQKFVAELIHPNVAQVHEFLGSAAARPSAPFAYTNDWGLAIAVTLPFFVLVWWRRGGAWRWAMLAVLAAGAVPIIGSLNRGLWMSIVAVVALTAVRSALSGRIRLLGGLLALATVAGVIVLVSPLGLLIQARLETPHSDEGRANLSTQSVVSALEGSPIIGFGSTRDVAGNFSSIAGGASHGCPKCAPPPLGTHGQAWLLIFASGFGGLMWYTTFFLGQLRRHWGSNSPAAPAALACLAVLLITMPIYNSIGVPLFIGFMSIGLLARESVRRSPPTLNRLTQPARSSAGIVLAVTLLGGVIGGLVHQTLGSTVRATQAVLVPAVNLTGDPDARMLSLDSEAILARSGSVLEAVGRVTGNADLDAVADQLFVGAEPNTRVLTIAYRDQNPRIATEAVETAVRVYLAERTALGGWARESTVATLAARQQSLNESLRFVENIASLSDTSPSLTARTTMNSLRLQRSSLFADAQVAESDDVGHPVTEVMVHQSSDAFLVRVGSGLSAGVVVGLGVVWRIGDRRRLRAARQDRALLDLPVVLETSLARAGGVRASRLLGELARHQPLCGLLADRKSATAVEFSRRFDSALGAPSEQRTDRVLLAVSERTRLDAVAKLRSRCRGVGVRPVGLVVVLDQEQREGVGHR